MFSVRWKGKLIPSEDGPHQFHLKSFDAKRIILDGDTLKMVYTSVEQYTELVELSAGKSYDFIVETENTSTGAARMQLFWKTPMIFEKEKSGGLHEKNREVYLPAGSGWYDFWTGKRYEGGNTIVAEAPIEIMPVYIKAGSIIPAGPFLQYATEKPADPIELRIYPGADGEFTLYEDENDNYNYEKGVYATIKFTWNDRTRTLTINERRGEFPGMLKVRTINVFIIRDGHGAGIEPGINPDAVITYSGSMKDHKF